jgi:hypothetical protein
LAHEDFAQQVAGYAARSAGKESARERNG